MEGASRPGFALHPEAPAHQPHELRRDRQAKSGTAIRARRGAVGLREGSKIRCCRSSGMPMPVSVTENCRTTSTGSTGSTGVAACCVTRSTTSPCCVNLMAFPSRLTRICRRRPESPLTACGISASTSTISSRPFWCALQRHGIRRVSDGVAGVEVDRVEVELAGFQPGEVQDVVDDRQQRIGRRFDDEQRLTLFGRELGVQHEIGHPDDTVHRGPDFVAHERQELALRPVRGFGGVLGRSQIGLRHLEIRRVPHDAQNLDRFAAGVAVDPALRADPMHRRVGPADPALQAQCASPERIFEGLVSGRPVLGTMAAKKCSRRHSR